MKKLIKVQYDGTDFFGYQVQPDRRTVQGELNQALVTLLGFECKVTGCSRTDSGVHARSFFATIEAANDEPITIPTLNIPRAMNSVLPDDISVIAAFDVEDSFHPRYDVVSKEYTYLLYDATSKDPLLKNKALHLPKKITDEQICKMNEACQHLVGKHDFASFMAEGSKVTDTRREIYYAGVEKLSGSFGEALLPIKICGDGFLYNMVRIITGTLLDVAYGKIEPSDMPRIIDATDRTLAGQTVPPYGLYLTNVTYQQETIK